MENKIEVMDQIKGIIISRLHDAKKINSLTYDTPLLSLGIDSIFALSILVEIEERFDIEIDDSDLNMDKIKNIRTFTELIDRYLA